MNPRINRKYPHGHQRRWVSALRAEVQADRQPRDRRPDLSENEILAWADAHHARTGKWPIGASGSIPESPGDTWYTVRTALIRGVRTLKGGSSLALLLEQHRRRRHPTRAPKLTISQILAWASAFHLRTGKWPNNTSGPIPEAPGETWSAVSIAIDRGSRGLPDRQSLTRLFVERFGIDSMHYAPQLTTSQILAWADAFHARTGRWPTALSGPVTEAPGQTWLGIRTSLAVGTRGLPGGSSLRKLLIAEGKLTHPSALTANQILAWADAHHARTGTWPRDHSGPIFEAPGCSWRSVNAALRRGACGPPGGSSLFKLLVSERGARRGSHAPELKLSEVLAWADAFHARIGHWPMKRSGPVPEAPGDTWSKIDAALRAGQRGLPAGSSLVRLFARERGARNVGDLPPFNIPEILRWADEHHNRHGTWPKSNSGPIPEAPGETWLFVHVALRQGRRELPGGSSLRRLLWDRRGVKCAPERKNFRANRALTRRRLVAERDPSTYRFPLTTDNRS
jgi:hypothetical protein